MEIDSDSDQFSLLHDYCQSSQTQCSQCWLMVYVAMVHGVIVICHMSGFPNQSLDSIHGHGSSESIQPWNDTSSASSGRICDDHLSQYHQHVCLYIYIWYIICFSCSQPHFWSHFSQRNCHGAVAPSLFWHFRGPVIGPPGCLWHLVSHIISIFLSFYLSICLSVYLPICLSVYLSICLSVYLSICLSIYIFVYIYIYNYLYIYICMEVSQNGDAPIHFKRIFHYKPSSYWRSPILRTPHSHPGVDRIWIFF